eukprot:scaffold411836_cov21-Prasinocladus_malaysianus.AAC.1
MKAYAMKHKFICSVSSRSAGLFDEQSHISLALLRLSRDDGRAFCPPSGACAGRDARPEGLQRRLRALPVPLVPAQPRAALGPRVRDRHRQVHRHRAGQQPLTPRQAPGG